MPQSIPRPYLVRNHENNNRDEADLEETGNIVHGDQQAHDETLSQNNRRSKKGKGLPINRVGETII
jgi:hypothetical protein